MFCRLNSVAAFLLGALSATGSIAAPCVSASDLTSGIEVVYEDGATGHYRSAGENLIELVEAGTAAGGGDLRFLSRYGLYDIEAAAQQDGVGSADHQVRYDFQGQPLFAPQPGGVAWTGTVLARFPAGDTLEETAAYVFGLPTEITLENCHYRSFQVNVTYVRGNHWEGQTLIYFPDLGLSALIGHNDSDGLADSQRLLALRPAKKAAP